MNEDKTTALISHIIGLAWADEVPFETIRKDFNLTEADVIKTMRANLKPGSFRVWRKRVSGRASKHERRTELLLRDDD